MPPQTPTQSPEPCTPQLALTTLSAKLQTLSHTLRLLSHRRAAERAATSTNQSVQTNIATECPICFEPLFTPGATSTKCGHVFHRVCLDRFFSSIRRNASAKCPVCRTHVHPAELVNLMNGLMETTSMTTSAAPATGNEVLKGEKKGVDILLTNAIASVAHTADMTSTMSQLEISLREGADRAAKKCQREIDDVQLQKRRLDEEIAEWRRCAARAMRDREREEKEMSEKMKGVNCEIEKCQALEKSLAEKEVEVEREREIVFQKRGCVRREIERLAEREQRLKSLFAKVRDSGGGCDGGGEIGRLRERLKRAEEIVRRNGLYGQVDEGVTKVDRGMFALEVGAKEGEDVEGVRRKRRRLDRRSVSGRGGGGLTGFVASRQAVQKPCGGVGQTRRGDVWTKKTSGTS